MCPLNLSSSSFSTFPRLPTLGPDLLFCEWEGRNLDKQREADDGKAVGVGNVRGVQPALNELKHRL